MTSAIIYVVIVAMWVGYFIPKWRARHDDLSGRSGDKFKNAIKMVSGEFSHTPPLPTREERAINLRRRRIAFLFVLLSFVIASGVVATTKISPLIELIPTSALMIYIVSVRRQAIAVQLRNRRLRVLEQISQAPVVIKPVENTLGRENSHLETLQEVHSDLQIHFETILDATVHIDEWVPFSERENTNGIVLLPRGSAILSEKNPLDTTSDTWNPIKVPLPTYVTAPKAVTPRRVIDLTVPGQWSANQKEEQALNSYLAEKELLPEREDGFTRDLENERVQRSHRASGE